VILSLLVKDVLSIIQTSMFSSSVPLLLRIVTEILQIFWDNLALIFLPIGRCLKFYLMHTFYLNLKMCIKRLFIIHNFFLRFAYLLRQRLNNTGIFLNVIYALHKINLVTPFIQLIIKEVVEVEFLLLEWAGGKASFWLLKNMIFCFM